MRTTGLARGQQGYQEKTHTMTRIKQCGQKLSPPLKTVCGQQHHWNEAVQRSRGSTHDQDLGVFGGKLNNQFTTLLYQQEPLQNKDRLSR
mmetsp:Transcript_64916/g.128257  ORF Transcript_64916/g.128257 Transcript_64916/m.128257 type:complete len:90 (-) Transcript_64916:66-335(-)